MKISHLRIRNLLGARDINAHLTAAVNLFCGFNGAGKSSIQEALRMAFQGDTLRVTHKKDYTLMVTDGAKEGVIKATVDGNLYEYVLPSGQHARPDLRINDDQLRCVLDAQRFAQLDADRRRAFLTVLTNTHPNKEKIRAMLAEAGIPEARIEPTIAMLTGGFPAACESAKAKATEAKGAWKVVTGETYGSKKGETWEAPEVSAPPQKEIDDSGALVATLENDLSEMQQKLGGIVERLNAQRNKQQEIADAQAKVKMLPRLKDKLVRDEEGLAQYKKSTADLRAKAGTAPKVGLVHDMAAFIDCINYPGELQADAEALVARYTQEFGAIGGSGDAEALAALPAHEKSLDLMERAVANDRRDIAAAEQAEELLVKLGELETVADDLLEKSKADVEVKKKALAEAREECKALTLLAEAAAQRDARTKSAKGHHDDVSGWLAIAEQLAPDGIPSQLLAQALKPINHLLRGYATATGWRQVAIAPTMEITADGRLYSLHSESEKWMIDAMIAGAIAEISGLKLMVLDRFDVLDMKNRPELLYWLNDIAAEGRIDSALLFGTLKAAPTGLPEQIQVLWIENGELETDPVAQAA